MASTMTDILPATWDMYEMIQAFLQAPIYHLIFEGCLILLILKLVFSKSYVPETVLTEKEKEDLIAEWEPEPLVPQVPEDHPTLVAMENNIIKGKPGKYVNIGGKDCLNMASLDFLGMAVRPEIEEDAVQTMRKYGVGSCGPRGFYGTMDVHLKLEEDLAKFMKCEEAILYSYGFSTIASAIPAYSKRGDIIFVDEGVNFSILKGLVASRSMIKWFKHNDTDDLERVLKEQEAAEKKNPKKAKATRKFLVIEAVYMKYADICPLPKLVELKWKYKLRIFMEESLSFGVLGKTGRGITEYYNMSVDDVELIAASLETSLGSCGGFCCGKQYIVDHQRLSGLGYCFSASLPPMLAVAANSALNILQEKQDLLVTLEKNCQKVHEGLSKIPGMQVRGDSVCAIKHLSLAEVGNDYEIDSAILQNIADKAKEKGVAVVVARYLKHEEHKLPPASIRVAVSSELTDDEVCNFLQVMTDACRFVLDG